MTAGHQNLHNLADRHDWRCQYCGRRVWCRTCCPGASRQTEATRDHIIPRSKGGRGPANLTLRLLVVQPRQGRPDAGRAAAQAQP